MTVSLISFGFCALMAVISGVMASVARHPVRSVLWLLPTLTSSAAIIALTGSWGLAILLITVVAVSVVLPFAVVAVMQGLDMMDFQSAVQRHRRLILMLIGIFAVEGLLVFAASITMSPSTTRSEAEAPTLAKAVVNDHLILLPLAGLILFTAMAGAIRLTLRDRPDRPLGDVVKRLVRGRTVLSDGTPGKGS